MTRLEVGASDDVAERAADRAADQALESITRAGGTSPMASLFATSGSRIRRATSPPGALDAGPIGAAGGTLDYETARRIDRSRGRPLDRRTRGEMEAGFGADLGGVRIHTGDEAASLSRRLGARAFTAGQDIFFGAGELAPGTAAGRRLVAHELAHTLQQRSTVARYLSHEEPGLQAVRHGLVHGHYTSTDNLADLHVDAKGTGPGLAHEDMLGAAEELLDVMTRRHKAKGPVGRFTLHPTGAAIVKIVVELLAASLGGYWSLYWASKAQEERRAKAIAAKKVADELAQLKEAANRERAEAGLEPMPEDPLGKPAAMSADRLDPAVLAEHFLFLDSMRGDKTVKIVPQLPKNEKYLDLDSPKLVDMLTQDMMLTTPEGNNRYALYKQFLQDPTEKGGASLDVEITHLQLPAIIKLIKKKKTEEEAKKAKTT